MDYEKPTVRVMVGVAFLDEDLDRIGGTQKVWDEDQKKEVDQKLGVLGVMNDKKKAEEYAPIWKAWCELTLKEPEKYSDFFELTGEEVLDIREGFFDAANPLKKRLAALRSSEASEPKAV